MPHTPHLTSSSSLPCLSSPSRPLPSTRVGLLLRSQLPQPLQEDLPIGPPDVRHQHRRAASERLVRADCHGCGGATVVEDVGGHDLERSSRWLGRWGVSDGRFPCKTGERGKTLENGTGPCMVPENCTPSVGTRHNQITTSSLERALI